MYIQVVFNGSNCVERPTWGMASLLQYVARMTYWFLYVATEHKIEVKQASAVKQAVRSFDRMFATINTNVIIVLCHLYKT